MSFCWRRSSASSNLLRQGIVKYVDSNQVVTASTVAIRFSRTLRDPVSASVMNYSSLSWFVLKIRKLNN